MASQQRKTEQGVCRLSAAQERYLVLKRRLDVALSLLLLALLAVPMLLISGLVKLSAPRQPVLFRQQRVGKDSALFTLCKFRSMDGVSGRVTRFGRFLRTSSLDELPQLFLVLRGSMSLIGPRPLIPQEKTVHALRRAAGVYRLRPGITGLAQISGRDLVGDREKAAFDRAYLENLCFAQDWRIFWTTIGKVLRRDGVRERIGPADG